MKKLISIIILCVMSVSAEAQQNPVPDAVVDLAGTWNNFTGSANGQYVCTWVAAHNFSCAVSFAYNGGTCHVTYPATWIGSAGWSYTSVYNSGTCPGTNGVWSGDLFTAGYSMCDYSMGISCTNNYIYFRQAGANSVAETNQGQPTAIEVPGTIGSGTSSGGEHASLDKGTSLYLYNGFWYQGEVFAAVLNDPGNSHASFSGLLTHEIVTSVNNTCLPFTAQANSYWTVDPTNDYSVGNVNLGSGDEQAYDFIGASWDYIDENQRSWTVTLPCTLTRDQRMTIPVPSDSGTINWIYEDHLLTVQIGDGWVKATRNGVGPQRSFGTKRSVWRTNDWVRMCFNHIAPCY